MTDSEFVPRYAFEYEEHVGWNDRCGITGHPKNAMGRDTTVQRVQLPGIAWEQMTENCWFQSEEEIRAWEIYGDWKHRLLLEIKEAMRNDLTPTQAKYIELYYFCGLNWRQIADLCGRRWSQPICVTAHLGIKRLAEIFSCRLDEYRELHP